MIIYDRPNILRKNKNQHKPKNNQSKFDDKVSKTVDSTISSLHTFEINDVERKGLVLKSIDLDLDVAPSISCYPNIEFVDKNNECVGCAMCAKRCPDMAIVEVHK